MTDGVNAVKNIKPKTQSPYCFICNSKIGVSSRNFLQLFGEKPHLINDTPLSVILSSIIHHDIVEDSSHSQIVCKKCNKLCVEYEELENRLSEIRTEVIQNYNKTIIKYGGRPLDIDTEQLLATLETSEDNSSFSQSREDIELENSPREHTEVIIPEQLAIPQNETRMHNKKTVKNEFVDDNVKSKIQNTEFEDSQESIEDDDAQEHHYFEEVEIITENHEEYNLLNNDEMNINDDHNSIDILETSESLVQQQHMDNNVMKTMNIKLEPNIMEINESKRQKNVKRFKPEQKIKLEVPDEGEEEKDAESEQQVIPTDSFTFGASTKGRPTVLYRNFEYVKLRENKSGEMYWRCKMYGSSKCKANLKTLQDQIISKNDQEHNHQGNISASLARLAIAQMKEKMGETSATPAAVVGTVSCQLDDHVLQALPKRASLSRSLQRHRKAALANNASCSPLVEK